MDSRYADCFSEYSNYFEIALILFKSVYGMNNSGNLFADELTEWLLEAGFIQSQCNMSIYISMHQMEQQFYYLMFITVYIGTLMKLLENSLWIL